MSRVWRTMMTGMPLGSMLMYVEAWRLATIENELVANTFADFTKYWTVTMGIGICCGLTSYVYSIQNISYKLPVM